VDKSTFLFIISWCYNITGSEESKRDSFRLVFEPALSLAAWRLHNVGEKGKFVVEMN